MNIARALKEEIARIARKEVRSETDSLKKSSARHRKEIASLKRRLMEVEGALRRASKATLAQRPEPDAGDGPVEPAGRFSAKGFAAHRSPLGLSALDMASLLGVSAQSVYHWEKGKSRPRASQMAGIIAVRKMGKREAAYRLSVMQR